MPQRDESQVLNNFEYGDTLQSSIAGTYSRFNMLDNLETVLPIIRTEPFAFDASMLLQQPEQSRGTVFPGTDIPVNPIEQGKAIGDKVREIFGVPTVGEIVKENQKEIKSDFRVAGKYILAACLGLLLVYFGFVILILPASKAVVKEVA